MIPVKELRESLRNLPTKCIDSDPPNQIAISNAKVILDQMEAHLLEATYLSHTADGGVGIVWHSVFTPGRYAHLECENNGSVTGVRADRKIEDHNNPDFCKFWWVTSLCRPEEDGSLQLSLAEALEHIRCYIWADHK
jgi:hypothetical protein